MSITASQIDIWIQGPSEHQRLEFKEARNQYDFGKLQRYCVALANEGGGLLLLGVSDRPPRRVVGSIAFPDRVSAAEKLYQCLGFRVDIEEVAHPQGRVVVFRCPSRPRGSAYHLDGCDLMRSGEELVPMSEDRLRSIFAEGQPDWVEQTAQDELDPQAVIEQLDVQTFFELLRLPMPTTRDAVLDRLKRERLIDEARDGCFSIRRLGALLLARRLADFAPEIARKAPRVVVYHGPSKVDVKLDQVGTKGYAVGFSGLVDFVMAQLPQSEVVEEALRKSITLVPEIMIRELVANALIHQDLTLRGTSIMVEIHPDRVEISNPGLPLVPVERFIDEYQSRNERLADLMRRLQICEERSSGIDRVVQAAESLQLPAPEFRAGHQRTTVILYGPRPFEKLDRGDRIRACYQHCVLRWVTRDVMTNQSLRQRFHLPDHKSATVSQIIAATIAENLIKPDEKAGSSKRLARYLPAWA